MRFWLIHSGEVPLQDQIFAQVTLGILSGELAPGERLPSVRELARRFHIHSNTVSLAYRRLEREHWLESRRGSGMYVQAQTSSADQAMQHAPSRVLDALMAQAVQLAGRSGIPLADLQSRLALAGADLPSTPRALLLLEPEPDFQRIILAELAAALPVPTTAVTWPCGDTPVPAVSPGTLVLVRPSKAAALRAALPAASAMYTLRISSVPQWLSLWLPAPTEKLVGVASQWAPFLDFAQTLLVAAGFSPDALVFRNPAEPNWHQGLKQTAALVCDAHTATLVPAGIHAIAFPMLAAEGLTELRTRCALAD